MSRLSAALGSGRSAAVSQTGTHRSSYRRAKSPLILTGVEELDKVLASQPSIAIANRAARSGLAKACRLLLSEIRASIPSRYKDAKRAMGHSIKMRQGETVAKVGAAVGKKRTEVNATRPSRKGRRGVGIGPENVHWFIKGTMHRTQKRTGRNTGKMWRDKEGGPLLDVVKNAWTTNRENIRTNLMKDVLTALDREYEKLARKAGRR